MSEVSSLMSADLSSSGDALRRLAQVRVELSVEIGRTTMSLGEALALGPGSVVAVDRLADEPVGLLVNGKLVARGEVVVIDSEYGLRVTEVVGADAIAAASQQARADEPEPVAAAPIEPEAPSLAEFGDDSELAA